MESNRNYSLDLLRIVSMLMIVTSHVLFLSNTLSIVTTFSVPYFIIQTVSAISYCFTNCFALISGFYLCERKFSITRILKIYGVLLFYSFGISLGLFLLGRMKLSKGILLKTFFPISDIHYWYITAYIGLCVIFPFVNIVISHISRKLHIVLIIALTVMFVLLPGELIGFCDPYYVDKGYNWLWFVYLFIIAAYIRKYGIIMSKTKILLFSLLCMFLTAFSRFLVAYITNIAFGKVFASGFLYRYNSVTVLLATVLIFLFFKDLKVEGKAFKKVVSILSPLMLGVYLIHMHVGMKEQIRLILSSVFQYNSALLYLQIFASVLIIFIICGIIEKLRQCFFSLTRLDYLIQKIGSYFDGKIEKGIK